MAEHVWSVLCHRATQDKQDNVVSLLEVAEKLMAHVDAEMKEQIEQPEESKAEEGRALMAVRLDYVTWWIRSDLEKPENAEGRAVIFSPDGSEFVGREFPIKLEASTTYRAIMRIPALPVDRGAGIFWFETHLKDGDSWRTAARVPVAFELTTPGSGIPLEAPVPPGSSPKVTG